MNRRQVISAAGPLVVGSWIAPLVDRSQPSATEDKYWEAQWQIGEVEEELAELRSYMEINKRSR